MAVCSTVSAAAQGSQPELGPPDLSQARVHMGIWAAIGVPTGDFSDNLGPNGGIGGDFDYRIGDTPIRLGVAVNGLFQDSATREVPFSTTIPEVLVDVTTRARMILTHARGRVQPAEGRVRPYAEGLFGFAYLYTRTSIDLGTDDDFDRVSTGTTNIDDLALSAGLGGGVAIELRRWPDASGRGGSRLNLDVGVQYLYGGEAEYLVGGPDGFDHGVDGLELRRSRTDLVQIQIGVSVDF